MEAGKGDGQAPFGEEWNPQITVNQYKFTGYERDSESNLDNAQARYYSSSIGRFMSPDPYNAGADPYDPQSWNMYSYVRNNPLNLTDPTGMDYQVCYFDDPEGPDGCQDYGGDTVDALNAQLGPGYYADGNDFGGDIFYNGGFCEYACNGGLVGTYFWFPGSTGGDSGTGDGGGAAGPPPNLPTTGPDPNGPWWQEGGPQLPNGLAAIFLPANCALDWTCGTVTPGFISCGNGGCPKFSTYQDYLNWLLAMLGPGTSLGDNVLCNGPCISESAKQILGQAGQIASPITKPLFLPCFYAASAAAGYGGLLVTYGGWIGVREIRRLVNKYGGYLAGAAKACNRGELPQPQ